MHYLLDSHVLFWAMFEPQKLSPQYTALLQLPDGNFYVSIVSLWELAIKKSLGKLNMPEDMDEKLVRYNVTLLPLKAKHIRRIGKLPFHHRDPFDRMLVAQAQEEQMTLLTDDRQLSLYDVSLL